MSSQAPCLSPREYLEIERKAEGKSEYINGQMFGMQGASLSHDRIATNVLASLALQLRGTACEVRSAGFRIQIPAFGVYTYPDASVWCGAPQFIDDAQDMGANPQVIVEVLSDSTKDYDRGEKFRYYRSISTFTEYLLLAQDEMRAERHERQTDGTWIMREFFAAEDEIALVSIGCKLMLGELYERVEFDA